MRNRIASEKKKGLFSYESVHLAPSEQIGLHRQDTWELSYVIFGAGKRLIGDTVSLFTSGEVLFIPPGIPHCWYFDEQVTDTRGRIANITLCFDGHLLEGCAEVFPELLPSIETIRQMKDAVNFDKETSERIIGLLEEMRDMTDALRIPSLIRMLLLIANCKSTLVVGSYRTVDPDLRKLEQIKTYVVCNSRRDITLEQVATYVGMSRSSFCLFFKRLTGKTFITYLNEFRIEDACRLLKEHRLNISEVCFQVGFNDVPYFNRVFKRVMGMPPGEYYSVISI